RTRAPRNCTGDQSSSQQMLLQASKNGIVNGPVLRCWQDNLNIVDESRQPPDRGLLCNPLTGQDLLSLFLYRGLLGFGLPNQQWRGEIRLFAQRKKGLPHLLEDRITELALC